MAAEYYEYNNRNNNHEKDGTKKQPGENMNIRGTKEQQDKKILKNSKKEDIKLKEIIQITAGLN